MSGTKARTVWNRASTLSVKTARQSCEAHLLEGLVRVDAGVVDQNGRGPEPGGDLLLGGDHGRGVGEVGTHGDRRATALLHLRDHVGGVGAIQHRHRGALACQPQRVGPADPARPAGDDGDPAVVAAGHDATSWGAASAPMHSNNGARSMWTRSAETRASAARSRSDTHGSATSAPPLVV